MDNKSIFIGHLSTFYHTSFILAGTDWLEKAGLEATWKLFASGPDIVSAFEDKEIDLGYLGLPPVIIGVGRGVPFKCVAGGHVEGTVMIAQREYQGIEDLGGVPKVLKQFQGKTIGTPPKGSIHDVIVHDLIEKLGYDIEVENYPWADFVLQAMVDGEIPAAAGTPPLAVAARRSCGAKIIVPPDRLWPNNPSYGIVVRDELMRQPDIIKSFLEQHERASNLIREEPQKASEIVSRLTQIVDPEFVMESYGVSPKYCAALSPEYVESTMDFVKVLRHLGYINRFIAEDEIFNYDFIKEVHPERSHYDVI